MGKEKINAKFIRDHFDYCCMTGQLVRLKKTSKNSPNNLGPVGTRTHYGYLSVYIKNKPYFIHRIVWIYVTGSWPIGEIDHINGKRDDNRYENLTDTDRSGQLHNMIYPQKNNKCGFRGVIISKNKKKWIAKIQCKQKKIYLGSFETKKEASKAYLDAKKILHKPSTQGLLSEGTSS